MKENIVGREQEIEKLEDYIASRKSEFIAIYGRRRVGKTFLVKELCTKDKEHGRAPSWIWQGCRRRITARDFIDVDSDIVSFNDPFFKLWIKRNIALL